MQAQMLARGQRERIFAALSALVAKRGYQGTTVELIVKRAGVSRATFYEFFDNREDCLLKLFDQTAQEVGDRLAAAAAEQTEWHEQVKAAITAFLDYVVAEPDVARTCLVESVTAGAAATERYERAMRAFSPALARGRDLDGAQTDLPETLEDSIVGGIVWMVHQRLLRNEIDQIPSLLPTMLEFALTPYLGERQAAQIAAPG